MCNLFWYIFSDTSACALHVFGETISCDINWIWCLFLISGELAAGNMLSSCCFIMLQAANLLSIYVTVMVTVIIMIIYILTIQLLPSYIILERMDSCQGVWAMAGEFLSYFACLKNCLISESLQTPKKDYSKLVKQN